MRKSGHRRRAAVLGVVAALAAAVALVMWGAGALAGLERTTVDARFDLRGARAAPDRVVVIGIDEDTQSALGRRWPFDRVTQGRALRRLAAAGPSVIGYDIQLAQPTADAADQAIADAIFSSPVPVVLATGRHDPAIGPDIMFLDEDLAAAGIAVGHAGFPATPDNVLRRVPLAVDGLTSFSAALAGAAAGHAPAIGGADALIDYAGPAGTVHHVAYEDVLSGGFDPAAVRGRIAIVGTTGTTLGDTHPTPFGGAPMAGAEVNANAVLTLLDGGPLDEAPRWLAVLVVVVLAGLGALAAWPRRAWAGACIAAGVALGYLALAQLLFGAGTVLPVTAPIVAMALACLGGFAATRALIDRERTRLRHEFARFVPPAVVDEVIDRAGEDLRLGGRRIYCSVMFADLRGFTAAAERMSPELVIEVLNRYLGEMTDAILEEGGTLVSYMGDGIMALFGAPIEQPDHADRALAAARAMRDVRLPAFNSWCEGRVPDGAFAMGIGVASGPVLSGNVGSERRLEYTAVGDTTNMASRLQALTKETPHAILIADATRGALVRPVPDLEAVGAFDVRGRRVPAAVWTLGGDDMSRG